MFDPDNFMDQAVSEANSTDFVPVPVGTYVAVVTSVTPRTWQSKSDPSKAGIALDVLWGIDDAEVQELLGRPTVTVKQGLMLDITEAGTLDMGRGRNVNLGRLREALHLNAPGQPFAPSMLNGRVGRVKVKHRADKGQIFAEVEAVLPL
jgi:hypothetical protein